MKIVLDTNVLMSGIFFRGNPHRILQSWRADRLQLVVSTEILAEYAEVAERLAAEFGLGEAETTIALMATRAEIVAAPQLPTQVCDDPDDDKFLACAVAAQVSIVISGDKALRRASGYRDVEVLTPRQFVDAHLPEQATKADTGKAHRSQRADEE